MGHDERTKGEAGQCQRQAGMGLAQMGDDGEHVLRLAAAVVMLARRPLDPAEIRPHGQEAACHQRLGQLVRHLVRGRAAQQRMRMRHHGDASRRAGGTVDQHFNLPGLAAELRLFRA